MGVHHRTPKRKKTTLGQERAANVGKCAVWNLAADFLDEKLVWKQAPEARIQGALKEVKQGDRKHKTKIWGGE